MSKTRHKTRDFVSLQIEADGTRGNRAKPTYYDEYRFSGKTFRKRDVFTNVKPVPPS